MEFFFGDRVRFTEAAYVSDAIKALDGIVEGYEEVDGEDFVIVNVEGPKGKFDQWVLPDELALVKRRGQR